MTRSTEKKCSTPDSKFSLHNPSRDSSLESISAVTTGFSIKDMLTPRKSRSRSIVASPACSQTIPESIPVKSKAEPKYETGTIGGIKLHTISNYNGSSRSHDPFAGFG